MTPDFSTMLVGCIIFGLSVVTFFWWRFGAANTLAFVIVSGGFSAVMDYISSFVVRNYEYPGQSPLWVAAFVFFGWIGTCGMCLLMAEGIVVPSHQDMLTERRPRVLVPLLTSGIAVVFDLFLDPIAVVTGHWVWLVEGTLYYGIPLLNYVGWFVLMFLAALAWMVIACDSRGGAWRKAAISVAALAPLCLTSWVLYLLLNGTLAAFGLR